MYACRSWLGVEPLNRTRKGVKCLYRPVPSLSTRYGTTNKERTSPYVPLAQALSVPSAYELPRTGPEPLLTCHPPRRTLLRLAAPWQKLTFIAGSPILSFLAYSLLHDVSRACVVGRGGRVSRWGHAANALLTRAEDLWLQDLSSLFSKALAKRLGGYCSVLAALCK